VSGAGHTPGPWRYFKEGNGTRFHVTARPVGTPGNHFDDFATVDIEHEADARLIAAAPDLLAACEAALLFFRREALPTWQQAQAILAAAIAKAKGGGA